MFPAGIIGLCVLLSSYLYFVVSICVPQANLSGKAILICIFRKQAQKLQKTIPSIKEMYCTIPVADKLKIQIKPLLQMQMEHY